MKIKKSVHLLSVIILFALLSVSLILAEIETSSTDEETQQSEIDKAYQCLTDQLGDNCGDTKSTKTAAFNLLSMAYDAGIQSDCKSSLIDKLNNNCWSETTSGTCDIKSTALAILALEYIGEDTDTYVDWLLSKRLSNTGLIWYMQVDATNKTACEINGNEVIIEDNKKISGTPPSGLSKAYSNYWFKIDDILKNYTISCDNDFIVALSYQKPGSNVYHITSETEFASEFDSLTVRVNSYCFSTSAQCDYEGSLWATLALANTGEEKNPYIPYLTAMDDKTENRKYIPASFLYILTGSDDYYDQIVDMQKTNHYWDESRNKFFDTALALFSLQGAVTSEVDAAKRYLINNQENTGCWPSDTNFLLYAGWPKSPATTGGGTISTVDCEEYGHYCVPISDCSYANTLNNFDCPTSNSFSSTLQTCCDVLPLPVPTCSEQNGYECTSDEICPGRSLESDSYNICCDEYCEPDEPEENACVAEGYSCESLECAEGYEEISSYSSDCFSGEVCCQYIEKPGGGSLWLIILLIVLIILVVLAIIFRNQLKVWVYKRKSKFKDQKQGRPPARPGFMPPGFRPRPSLPPRGGPMRRPMLRRGQAPNKDREFDDTMKKLREMSK